MICLAMIILLCFDMRSYVLIYFAILCYAGKLNQNIWLCCVLLCFAMLLFDMLCFYAVLCFAMTGYAVPAMLCYAMILAKLVRAGYAMI